MSQLTNYGGGDVVAYAITKAMEWLKIHAEGWWHSVQRWWGGSAQEAKIWASYKEARQIILGNQETKDIRSILLADLRVEYRQMYPQYSSNWT